MFKDTVKVNYEDRKAFLGAYRLFIADDEALIATKNDSKWSKTIWRLKNASKSPYEFFYYVVYHLGDVNPARARYKNLVTSDTTWYSFKSFKSKQKGHINGLVASQRSRLMAELKDADTQKILLKPPVPISSAVILDTALLLSETEDINMQEILDKFLADAVFVVYCSPEFLESCIHLKLYLNKEDLW